MLRLDPAVYAASEWILAPVRWTTAETCETELTDRYHIRMNQLAAGTEARFIVQLVVPVAINIHHGTFEGLEYPEELGGAFVADIAGDNDRIEVIFLIGPQLPDSHQIVVDVR